MLETLNKYYEEGWLIKQTHPNLPLTIWNYSQQTQYEGKWDEITLACRGLVTLNETGEVIARPFKKFFNMEEGKHTPTSEFEVYEKMDGSLGIAFYYQDRWVFASRGSFTSDQAIKGYKMFVNLLNTSRTHFSKGYTYLFEIIYPENRIVVDYMDAERLVLLGKIGTISGEEYSLDSFRKDPAVDVVREYTIKDYTKLKTLIGDNFEGFVVRFSNGDRMKIKGEEYLRLHKIMTEISTKSVWEILSNGDNMEGLLEDVPDEFYSKIKEYERELLGEYNKIETISTARFNEFKHLNKKEYAEQVKFNKYNSVLFLMYDGKDYSKIIWRIIQPEFRKL